MNRKQSAGRRAKVTGTNKDILLRMKPKKCGKESVCERSVHAEAVKNTNSAADEINRTAERGVADF